MIHCICEVVGHVPLFQINKCGININIGRFRFVTACLSTHHAIGIRGLLCLKETWPSTRNSKRLVGFSSIGRSRLIGSRATRLSALSSLIRPLFPFLFCWACLDSNDVARPVLDVASVESYSPLSFQNTGRTSSPSRPIRGDEMKPFLFFFD